MKRLLLISIISLFMIGSVFGAEKKKEEKFEVTIEVVYNAVSAEEAAELQKKVLSTFPNTCKTKVITKKVESSIIWESMGTVGYTGVISSAK